ncbi:MAG: hypothetical protein IT211_02545 [Armatimonadetes bacterium]|nr:hypothetical protein [Armatimonadota bacterium]
MHTHALALWLRRFGLFLMIAAMGITIAGCDPEPTDPDAIDNGITVTATLTPDNGQLVIPKVTAVAKSWLVIRRDNGSGAPLMSEIIAKLQLPVGATTNARVTLEGNVSNGERLWAMLHLDNGAEGTFEYTGSGSPDQPAVNNASQTVQASFTINQSTPTVIGGDQQLSNNRVGLDVAAAEDGWMAIYADNGSGAPGVLLGKTHVNAGPNGTVMVALDTAAANAISPNATLWGVLHIDRGVEGTFEFPGADQPVSFGGSPVRVWFKAFASPTPRVLTTPQKITNNTINIDKVESTVVGWIVLHETDANDDPILATSIGRARVSIGATENIVVAVEKSVPAGTLLAAVLHRDDPAVGTWQSTGETGPDAPVTLGGAGLFVVSKFRVQ